VDWKTAAMIQGLHQIMETIVNKFAQLASALAVVLALSLSHGPAQAQSEEAPAQAPSEEVGGLGDFTGGNDMMTKMAPMLDTMKQKLGKRRFEQLMKTVGPIATNMMGEGGSFGGFNFNNLGGGSFGGFDFDSLGGGNWGGFDIGGLSSGFGGIDVGSITSMVPRHGGRKRWRHF
jgi:hypothetical protein